MNTDKFCQSCAMPLSDGNRCTTNSGEVTKYCNFCMDGNGKFRDPNITFDEMHERGLAGIDKSDSNRFVKWMSKKTYKSLLAQMERWT